MCAFGEERQGSWLQPGGGCRVESGEKTPDGAKDLSRWGVKPHVAVFIDVTLSLNELYLSAVLSQLVMAAHGKNNPLCLSGGPVDKVFPGDEILEIEGVSMTGKRRLDAWSLIRKLPAGPVDVVICRPVKVPKT